MPRIVLQTSRQQIPIYKKIIVCLCYAFLLALLAQAGNLQAAGQDIPIDTELLKKAGTGECPGAI